MKLGQNDRYYWDQDSRQVFSHILLLPFPLRPSPFYHSDKGFPESTVQLDGRTGDKDKELVVSHTAGRDRAGTWTGSRRQKSITVFQRQSGDQKATWVEERAVMLKDGCNIGRIDGITGAESLTLFCLPSKSSRHISPSILPQAPSARTPIHRLSSCLHLRPSLSLQILQRFLGWPQSPPLDLILIHWFAFLAWAGSASSLQTCLVTWALGSICPSFTGLLSLLSYRLGWQGQTSGINSSQYRLQILYSRWAIVQKL